MIPGPGFFPFAAAVLLGVMSAITLVKSFQEANHEFLFRESTEKLRWQNVVCVLMAMFSYALSLHTIGFVLCTFCIVFFFLRGVAAEGWVKAIVVSFLITVGSYLLFKVFLRADLPKGIFFL